MGNISLKEFLISVVVVILALAFAIFINPFLTDSMYDELGKMRTALQVDDDTTMFQYAHKTEVGNVLSYGQLTAVVPVGVPELSGTYGLVQRVTERYTMHTRQVCNSYDKDGHCESYRTEVYYTWDTYRRDETVADQFMYLGEQFPSSILGISWQDKVHLDKNTVSQSYVGWIRGSYLYQNGDWWESEGDLRYYYLTLPSQFYATMFVRFFNGGISNPANPHQKIDIYYEQGIAASIAYYERSITVFNVVYYIIVIVFIAGGYYYWAYRFGDVE